MSTHHSSILSMIYPERCTAYYTELLFTAEPDSINTAIRARRKGGTEDHRLQDIVERHEQAFSATILNQCQHSSNTEH